MNFLLHVYACIPPFPESPNAQTLGQAGQLLYIPQLSHPLSRILTAINRIILPLSLHPYILGFQSFLDLQPESIMDSKEPTTMATHIEDTPVKSVSTVEEADLALGLLLNDEERKVGLMKSAWNHKRIIFMCKQSFHYLVLKLGLTILKRPLHTSLVLPLATITLPTLPLCPCQHS